jgi:hypothetical protein
MSEILQEKEIYLGDTLFGFVTRITPLTDDSGKLCLYRPHIRYKGKGMALLDFGEGPFCKFSISSDWAGISGVYAIFADDKLLYIGRTVDFRKRFSAGYGNISPRNCYVGGQSTNCKLNHLILREILSDKHINLFFAETTDYDRIEHTLIAQFNPPLNGRVAAPQPLSFNGYGLANTKEVAGYARKKIMTIKS